MEEQTIYKDTGCSHAAKCLECPYPKCLYETPHAYRSMLQKRNAEIRVLAAGGVPVSELINRFGVATRTIYRVVNNK